MSDEAVLFPGNLVLWEARDRHSCTLVFGLAQAGQVLQSSKMLMLCTGNVHMGAHKEIHAHVPMPRDVQAQAQRHMCVHKFTWKQRSIHTAIHVYTQVPMQKHMYTQVYTQKQV